MARAANACIAVAVGAAATLLLVLGSCSIVAVSLLPTADAQATRDTVKPNPALLARVQSLNKQDMIKYFVDNLRQRGQYNFILPNSNSSEVTSLRDAAAVFESSLMDDVGCKPVPQVVKVRVVENAVTYPQCVMLERCGGCCSTPLHECSPKANSTNYYNIQVLRFYSSNDVDQLDPKYETERMEVHTACECQCRIKATDCNPRVHTYDADNCQCNCKDTSSARLCTGNRRWSHDSCSCECILRPESCPAGSLLDSTSCQCLANQGCVRAVIQPATSTTPAPTTPGPCAHLSCPQRYKGVPSGTGCRCAFSLT